MKPLKKKPPRPGFFRCAFISFLIVLIDAMCPSSARAGPLSTPLAQIEDPIGAALQQAMIWIPADSQAESDFIAFRKRFDLASAPREAILHIFADARYILWINGRPVSRGPARFDPRGPEYDSVDVASSLHSGENQITVLVMSYDREIKAVNGRAGQGYNARMMKHTPALTLRLDIGSKPVLSTDESWRWSDHTRYRDPLIDWANIKDHIDARAEDGDWTQPDYDDQAWKPAARIIGDAWGPLSARRTPLLRDTPVAPELSDGQSLPVSLVSGQKLSFKLGRLVQAYTILELDTEEGTELSLNHAKVGYTARAGRQTYISSDSRAFDGGVIAVKSGRATIIGLKLIERIYPFDRVGRFESNDPLLNRVWEISARTCELLSEDAYVDCADRERAEWMDCDPPAFDVTRTAFSASGPDGKPRYADARLLGAMLRRTALSQQKEGWVKAHTCSDRFDIHAHMEDRSCDWVQGARRYYESTGDAALIREIWPVIDDQLDYFLARRTGRGLVHAREWVVWGNPVGYVTCEGAGLNAFVYKALLDAAWLGQAIGLTDDTIRLGQAAKELATAFNTTLWNEADGTYYSAYYPEAERTRDPKRAMGLKLAVTNDLIAPTFFPALFALDQGIVPVERVERVRAYMLSHRAQAKRVMTFYYLFNQLYREDTDAFDREILQAIRQHWGSMAASSWGTTSEDFNGGSKAHIYGMFPGYHLSAYVLGVRRDGTTAAKRILVEPRLGDLTSAEGIVVTEHGPVPVSWKIEPGQLRFRVEIPAGVKATLRIPRRAADARLEFTDKSAGPAHSEGRYFVAEVGPGLHSGKVTFTEPATL